MDLSDYKYLSALNGIAFVGIMLGNTKIDKLDVVFSVDLKERQFDFCVEDMDFQRLNHIDYYYWRKSDFHADKLDYLYCVDENNIPFTVYGCSICPLNSPLKSIRIVWNDIIVGQHISDKNALFINKMQCVAEDSKNQYRCSVGRNDYVIEKGEISVKTDWSSFKDEETNRNVYNGVLFELNTDSPISLEKMKEAFNNLLEMHSLWIGYFPEIKDMRFSNGSDEFIYTTHYNVNFSAKRNVNLNRRLFPVNNDFSVQYDKWVKIREKNIPVFTMFKNALNGRDIIHEARTAMLIQCLEGYFHTHHKEKLIKKEFIEHEKNSKELLLNTVTNALEKSDEIQSLFGEDCVTIIESVKNILGGIHRMSLRETILFAINYTLNTHKVFNYEANNKISENQTQLDKFIQKAKSHRDFLSHLFHTDKYFNGKENDLAREKLELLLRLCVLHDIRLEVTEKSLDDYINTIEREFYK